MDPRAICERCSLEIDFDEVNVCDECGYDGLCGDCYAEHDCEEE